MGSRYPSPARRGGALSHEAHAKASTPGSGLAFVRTLRQLRTGIAVKDHKRLFSVSRGVLLFHTGHEAQIQLHLCWGCCHESAAAVAAKYLMCGL